jgi:hypothetical protein
VLVFSVFFRGFRGHIIRHYQIDEALGLVDLHAGVVGFMATGAELTGEPLCRATVRKRAGKPQPDRVQAWPG